MRAVERGVVTPNFHLKICGSWGIIWLLSDLSQKFLSLVHIYNIVASIYIELPFSFLKMQKNFCVLVYFLLPGNF